MADTAIHLTRRRLLGGLAVLGGASAAAGAGTAAYFSDSAASVDNAIQAGTLDLTLNGASQTVTFLDVDGVTPGDSGSQSITLGNAGSIDGTLEVVLEDVRDYENGIQGNENSQDSTSNQGELQEYVDVRAELDGTQIADWVGLDQLQALSLPYTHSTGETITAGDSKECTLFWRFNDPGDDSVRDAQSDSVELDLTFRLVQP